jgi:hypothetical protein
MAGDITTSYQVILAKFFSTQLLAGDVKLAGDDEF